MSLHEAVDELQASAVASGIVDMIGQDHVQEIMAVAFRCSARPPLSVLMSAGPRRFRFL
jgi:hypothetical protein